ncbi:MAG: hypothetical protein RLZ83_387 [Pseudomonadota bacterium]|jgi:KDO2-lipid IV(A) lauroyltransferase
MLALIGWLSRLPLRWIHLVGTLLGWAAWLASPRYRLRLHDHAAQAGVREGDRRASVGQAGCMTAETPRLWLRATDAPLQDPVQWVGADLIERALGRPGGVLLLTPHLGAFEFAAQAYAERFGARQPMTVLYRPARKRWLRELEAAARARPGLSTAPATLAGVRQMLRALRQGQTVGLLPDQVPPEGQGVWAPFFGRPAYTMTLAARLVRQTGALPLAAWCERLPRGAGYRVCVQTLSEALPAPPSAGGDPQAEEAWTLEATSAINRSMEALVRQCPAQYLWGYHRYKAPRQGSGTPG